MRWRLPLLSSTTSRMPYWWVIRASNGCAQKTIQVIRAAARVEQDLHHAVKAGFDRCR
jgi:hypothetical protein